MDKVDLLIEILLDEDARLDERDDAAMDLGNYDSDKALAALSAIALRPDVPSILNDSCGESIGEIWVKRDFFDIDMYNKFTRGAKKELYGYILMAKLEWIDKYRLHP